MAYTEEPYREGSRSPLPTISEFPISTAVAISGTLGLAATTAGSVAGAIGEAVDGVNLPDPAGVQAA